MESVVNIAGGTLAFKELLERQTRKNPYLPLENRLKIAKAQFSDWATDQLIKQWLYHERHS